MTVDAAEITRVSALVGGLARRDVSGLSHGDLMEAHDAVARLGRLAGTLQARFAGEIARRSTPDLPGGGLARRQGFGNAGAMVSRVTGGTTAGAMRAIEAGLALMPDAAPTVGADASESSGASEGSGASDPTETSRPDSAPQPRYPAVAEAALAGDLSVDAAGLITAGLETLTDRIPRDGVHDLERRLVEKAVHLAVHEVRSLVATAVARADLPGHEEREHRHHADRYVAWKEDHTGMVTFTGKLDAVTAAPIRTVIEQIVTHDFRARRDQDPASPDQRTVGQMRADALFEVCRHALGCKETDQSGVRTTIVVRMNKRDLDAGRGLGSIDGTHQPVSVGELRRLAGDAGIIPEVLSGDSEVLDLGRSKRMFTGAQRIALIERDGGCAKCHAPPEHCEAHHIRWWEKGGRTDLANGVMLCTRCHHDIHRQGWGIVISTGTVDFIPPPHIDPARRPIPGGRAALEIRELDRPSHHPRDHSA
ncbi:MAG: HNH endonuclease [Actinobacteria bacterium HGW-Actinobacteria-8]|nr:MAG: HNH endonuclease [Actinobacteria bacterium HGW-Actinobacteria-8]